MPCWFCVLMCGRGYLSEWILSGCVRWSRLIGTNLPLSARGKIGFKHAKGHQRESACVLGVYVAVWLCIVRFGMFVHMCICTWRADLVLWASFPPASTKERRPEMCFNTNAHIIVELGLHLVLSLFKTNKVGCTVCLFLSSTVWISRSACCLVLHCCSSALRGRKWSGASDWLHLGKIVWSNTCVKRMVMDFAAFP